MVVVVVIWLSHICSFLIQRSVCCSLLTAAVLQLAVLKTRLPDDPKLEFQVADNPQKHSVNKDGKKVAQSENIQIKK